MIDGPNIFTCINNGFDLIHKEFQSITWLNKIGEGIEYN